MPRSLMKRLSKSATDLSFCKKKTRTNSDEDFQENAAENKPSKTSDDECERPGSSLSSRSVPAISLIGRGSLQNVSSRFGRRGRSRSQHRSGDSGSTDRGSRDRGSRDRSIAAEIEAVQKSSNFGLFGLLRQKFRLSHKDRLPQEEYRQNLLDRETPPEVRRIRCESDRNPNYQADTESAGSTESINQSNNQSINKSPIKLLREIKQKKIVNIRPNDTFPEVENTTPEPKCGEDDYYDTPEPNKDPSNEQESSRSHSNPFLPSTTFRQDSRSSFMSLLSRNKGGSLDDPRPNSPALMRDETNSLPDTTFHSIEDIQEYSKYHLLIHLRQGQDLPAKDSCGTSDPYIKFLLASKMVYKSKTIYKDLNPFWDENFYITIEDLNLPLELKVYDYDWGLRDDFIGQGLISLKTLILNQPQDIVVTLHETGNIKYLGQISLNVKLIPLLPDTPHPPLPLHPSSSISHHSSFSHSPARGLELAARRLKPGTWSAIVNILLVEGTDLLAMDIEGTSDPYCKFRLGSDRFKTKTIYGSLNPKWNEEFDLYLYDESELEITVWDKDQRSKDDFMGRGCIDLSTLSREESHHLWIQLEEGSGQIFIILTISGTTGIENPTFLSNWDNTNSIDLYREKYTLKQSLANIDDVGVLIVKVFRARGLHAADLGGSSDPYCVLELDNTRVLTHTEYKTLEPSWQKVFVLSVQDVHSVLNITVFDEDKNHKSEFLGRLVVPLIKIKNQNKRWFALKDKKLRCRAKGHCPQIQMEFILHWNIIRATYTTLNPKKTLYKEAVEKFKRQVFINNVMRIKAVILEIVDFGVFIQSCLEWESTSRSIIAFITFMTISYYFEPYMVPVGLLLIFLKQYIYRVYLDPKHLEREEQYLSEDDDEMDEKDEDKEEKKSLKEKLQAIQDVTAMVQNALGYVASLAEGVKNTFNFSVPFLSWLAVIIFSIIAVVLYFIPLRVLIMVWGVNKFGKKLVRPDTVTNNELMDFLSRVPSDEDLLDARELRLQPDTQETGKKSTVKKKHKQS